MLGIVRFRRYRSLLLFAIITTIVFVHFYSFGDTTSSYSVEKLKEYTATVSGPNAQDAQRPVVEVGTPVSPPEAPPIEKPTPRPSQPKKSPPAVGKGSSQEFMKPPSPKLANTVNIPPPRPADVPQKDEITIIERPDSAPVSPVQEHWLKSTENFPIPEESLISLPKKYKELPQIQASFAKESENKRKVRVARQKAVKDAMRHAWKGYRTHAWGHDEVMPVSKSYKDPFGGWGATLVDSLDTLWIMGLEQEFLEAVKAVSKIDFTTTPMQTIPVFETVIRYLGGLIGAFDVSGGKHRILLDKAIELGDMLYGIFDTPNRMPMLYWGWRPRQVDKKNRAGVRVISAELGSLTVEFTRLAQITGNNSYYDAVQRITDALEEFQFKTDFPGMWPLTMDASGCQVVNIPVPESNTTPHSSSGISSEGTSVGQVVSLPVHQPSNRQVPRVQEIDWLEERQGGKILPESERDRKGKATVGLPPVLTLEDQGGRIHHEEEEYGRSEAIVTRSTVASTSTVMQPRTSPSCKPQGLTNARFQRERRFTLGALADSLYEYLIKEYILLGGASDKYKRMYESFIDLAKKRLFYRPLAENDPDVLLSGNINVNNAGEGIFDTDSGHLTCFTGGMLALGARALNREADLEIGAKLTDGCVWAYFSFESGIMPESFGLAYCQDADNCVFNKTQYYEQLVPKSRLPKKKTGESHQDVKRDGPSFMEETDPLTSVPNKTPTQYPTTLEGLAKKMIEDEGLPTGFTKIMDRRYILRPEAIESVFIMYRITADSTWQDKGWRMFQSLDKLTRTEFAFSAINDVTKGPSDPTFAQLDSMESFFAAETLKYYYLLFSEPDLISLDDYVLNTEAHPLKRPHPSS